MSWNSKKLNEKSRVMCNSKKRNKDISDKRALTKVIANSSTFSDINSEQVSGTTSTRRLSNGKVAKVVSSKISKTFRRTSIGNSNKKEEKSSSNTFGNCFKRVIQTQSSKENTTNKPLKAHPASSFTFNKMIKSYQDRRESKLTESPKVSGLKNIKQRSSNIFSRLTRDSSVGDKDRNKPTLSYVPMAEMIMKLENTTPDRYRTLPNRGRSQNINPSLTRSRSNSSVPRINPKSPKLLTKEKSRQCRHTKTSHETLPSPLPKNKKPQRKVCSSESVNSVQSQASCSNIPKTKSVTKIQPFSFDPKIAESEAKKALKFKEVLEKESKDRKFKATSIPNFHKPINLPIKECTIPTIVEPFNLDIESRLEARIKKREENLKLEEKKQKELTKFKARPAKTERTFAPLLSTKPVVEIVAFELHSDRRVQERKAFDLRKKEKGSEMQELEKKLEEKNRSVNRKMTTFGQNPNIRTKTRSLSKEG
ncbi:uncharacterized protein [Lepeophtheirus salmonis]|uniref:uncharacterized protein isoform X1 n=1 Tax=Lepeophtheirus salmonis TaxID=72036 RepID=UPI001AEB5CA9|nr:titin homolog isoform X1 [Lepeophtheirus salmonis]